MKSVMRIEALRWRSFVAAASLIVTAWLALLIWSLSPYAQWLDHSRIAEIAAPLALRLTVFTIGWALMTVAMMLPGTLLLLAHCAELRQMKINFIAPMLLAYLASWMAFGSLNYLGDSLLHEFAERIPALATVIAPGVVLLAGVYQLTPLKRVCLSRCRPDGAVLMRPIAGNAWAAGLQHAIFSLGNCWALMLLMFAMGGVDLSRMLLFTGIMTAERSLHRGHLLSRPLGFALILGFLLTVILAQSGL